MYSDDVQRRLMAGRKRLDDGDQRVRVENGFIDRFRLTFPNSTIQFNNYTRISRFVMRIARQRYRISEDESIRLFSQGGPHNPNFLNVREPWLFGGIVSIHNDNDGSAAKGLNLNLDLNFCRFIAYTHFRFPEGSSIEELQDTPSYQLLYQDETIKTQIRSLTLDDSDNYIDCSWPVLAFNDTQQLLQLYIDKVIELIFSTMLRASEATLSISLGFRPRYYIDTTTEERERGRFRRTNQSPAYVTSFFEEFVPGTSESDVIINIRLDRWRLTYTEVCWNYRKDDAVGYLQDNAPYLRSILRNHIRRNYAISRSHYDIAQGYVNNAYSPAYQAYFGKKETELSIYAKSQNSIRYEVRYKKNFRSMFSRQGFGREYTDLVNVLNYALSDGSKRLQRILNLLRNYNTRHGESSFHPFQDYMNLLSAIQEQCGSDSATFRFILEQTLSNRRVVISRDLDSYNAILGVMEVLSNEEESYYTYHRTEQRSRYYTCVLNEPYYSAVVAMINTNAQE